MKVIEKVEKIVDIASTISFYSFIIGFIIATISAMFNYTGIINSIGVGLTIVGVSLFIILVLYNWLQKLLKLFKK